MVLPIEMSDCSLLPGHHPTHNLLISPRHMRCRHGRPVTHVRQGSSLEPSHRNPCPTRCRARTHQCRPRSRALALHLVRCQTSSSKGSAPRAAAAAAAPRLPSMHRGLSVKWKAAVQWTKAVTRRRRIHRHWRWVAMHRCSFEIGAVRPLLLVPLQDSPCRMQPAAPPLRRCWPCGTEGCPAQLIMLGVGTEIICEIVQGHLD